MNVMPNTSNSIGPSTAGSSTKLDSSSTSGSSSSISNNVNILLCPSTGGQHKITVSLHDSISEFKRKVSRQTHIPQDKFNLLFKEKLLNVGNVADYNLSEGCKVSLIPVLKCGFSSTVQGPQQSIMQAIEGLSDEQIDEFLSARSPLTLALRTGDHIMFVQLHIQHYISSILKSRKPKDSQKCNCRRWKCYHVIRQMINSTTSTGESCSTSGMEESQSPDPISNQDGATLRTKTYGRITSGIGSLSNPGLFGTGSRFLRQMQRLRRLCGGHQQCVAYSSREVASEISSIVHASRHASNSEYKSSRSSLGKHSSRDHVRKSNGSPRQDASFATSQPYATRIDSVTAHGPGVFSGTFSGTLDSSIHNEQGELKREPNTVLRILTELLCATEKYEKQSGNVSVMSQLFKDHFSSPPTSSRVDDSAASSSSQVLKPASTSQRKRRHSSRSADEKSPSNPLFGSHPKLPRNSMWNTPFKESLLFGPNDNLTSSRLLSTCRRLHQSSSSWHHSPIIQSKLKRIQAIMNNPRIQRLRHENDKTELKMAYLRHLMDEKRKQKLLRKITSDSNRKPIVTERNIPQESACSSGETPLGSLRRTSIEVQASEIAQFSDDRQPEVTHETAETASG